MTTTTKLVHANGSTITVFKSGPHHWYADWSNLPEVEWLGGCKSASAFVARMVRQGWIPAQ